MKSFNFKRTILSSIISVTLCVAMLLGSTMAWFTSTAENKGNRIEAGILDVDLLMYKDKADGEGKDYVSIKGSTSGDIFSEATGNGTKWEPGKTEIVYLKVENKGNLAFKYNIKLQIAGGDTENPTDISLASALEYAVLDGVQATDASLANVTSWAAIKEIEGVQTGSVSSVLTDSTVAENGKLGVNGSDYFALAVHMKENAGNEYMDKALAIDVKVVAGQTTDESETDSLGGNYDSGADVPYYVPENLILDGGSFESGKIESQCWHNTSKGNNTATVVAYEDGYCLALNKTDGSQECGVQLLANNIKELIPGATYKLSFKVKAENYDSNGDKLIYLRFKYNNVNNNVGTTYINGEDATDWVTVEKTITLGDPYTQFGVWLYANGKGTVYGDDFRLELVE